MAYFRVVSSEVVYHDIIVEAENEDEAIDKAWKDDTGWNTCGVDSWQIDECKEVQ